MNPTYDVVSRWSPSSMPPEGTIFLISMMLGAMVLLALIIVLSRGRSRRLQVMQKALESNALDAESKQLLTEALTGGGPARALRRAKAVATIGWLGLFLGIGMLASGERDFEEGGLPVALLSFGVLTLPFAMRELERNDPSRSTDRR